VILYTFRASVISFMLKCIMLFEDGDNISDGDNLFISCPNYIEKKLILFFSIPYCSYFSAIIFRSGNYFIVKMKILSKPDSTLLSSQLISDFDYGFDIVFLFD